MVGRLGLVQAFDCDAHDGAKVNVADDMHAVVVCLGPRPLPRADATRCMVGSLHTGNPTSFCLGLIGPPSLRPW